MTQSRISDQQPFYSAAVWTVFTTAIPMTMKTDNGDRAVLRRPSRRRCSASSVRIRISHFESRAESESINAGAGGDLLHKSLSFVQLDGENWKGCHAEKPRRSYYVKYLCRLWLCWSLLGIEDWSNDWC
jgi:hypothetical protein